MTVAKSRGATRKLGPISTGSKIVRSDIPNLTRRFTVHEDVICRSSKVFKAHFQQQCKEITTSCSTCFDDLDAVTEKVTFYDKCGQNFHEACIGRWLMEQRRTSQPTTCPMCRGNWTDRSRPDIEHLRIEQELNGQMVQVYFEWLYSDTVRIDASVPRTNDDFNVVLLQCWEVSDLMGDEAFREAVLQEFSDEAEAQFWAESIDYVFVDGKRSDAMCDFVMDIFLSRVDNDWFKTEDRKWPKTFEQKLATHCLKKALSGEKTETYEEIETVYVKPQKEEEKDEMTVLVSTDEDDVEELPLSDLSRTITRGSMYRPHFEAEGYTDRDTAYDALRSSLLQTFWPRPSRSSTTAVADVRGHDSARRDPTPEHVIPARRGRLTREGFAALHGGPARPRSFGDMPFFGGAWR